MAKRTKKRDQYYHERLRRHLSADPAELAVVERNFPLYHRANLQMAIDHLTGQRGVKTEIDGIVLPADYEGISLAKLSRKSTSKRYPSGPIEHYDAPLADGKSLTCVKRGVFFIRTKAGRLAMLVGESQHRYPPVINVEAMGETKDVAQDFLRELAIETERAPAFRGKVISLEVDCHHQPSVRFHKLPDISLEQIILPKAVLERIDRHAVGFVKHAERLRAAGRHLKRGVLLHGPPGTGKTLCAMLIAAQLPGRTVMILTAGGISSIETCGAMARSLAPATIILEDVDLIGTMREHQTVGANALLFELLNQMDGLSEDADVLFVLSTNRPELLEPALASRPGRIDQAIEIPLPDAECRRRLFELYCRGLDAHLENIDHVIERTKGVSAAFIREVVRKAALLAVEQDGNGDVLTINGDHLNRAVDELLIAGGPMTQRLLGAAISNS